MIYNVETISDFSVRMYIHAQPLRLRPDLKNNQS